jgi:hypothetical protein
MEDRLSGAWPLRQGHTSPRYWSHVPPADSNDVDAAVWEVTPGSRELAAVTPVDANTGVDVLGLLAVGAMLLGLGVMNSGMYHDRHGRRVLPVLVASGIPPQRPILTSAPTGGGAVVWPV